MEDLRDQIKEKMSRANSPLEFAQVIDQFGLELMESGKLDSDELLWEVGRELWSERGEDFEAEVYKEIEKLF